MGRARVIGERFRVYRLRDGELDLLATTPTPEGAQLTVVTLFGEGEFGPADAVGVLDALPSGREEDQTGVWVVNPWDAPSAMFGGAS